MLGKVKMTVEWAESARKGSAQLEPVESISVLVLAAADCSTEAVQGVHLPGMMTSMFWGPGPLVCALVPVEMLQPCAAPGLMVGEMPALISMARKRCAGVNWAAQVVGLYILVQDRLENDGLMKGALVPAELLALLAAVLGTMGMHQKVESE